MNRRARTLSLHGAWPAAFLAVLCGCATVGSKEDSVTWEDLLAAPEGEAQTFYGLQRLEADRQLLEDLAAEADALETDVLRVRRAVRFRDQPYLSQEQNDAVALLLRRAVNLRASLGEINEFYRSSRGTNEAAQVRGMVIGLAAGARDLSFSSFLAACWMSEKDLRKAADAAFLRYDIPRESFAAILSEVTHPALDHRAELAYRVCAKALADRGSVLAGLEQSDPPYAALITMGERAFAEAQIRTRFIKSELGLLLPELNNELRHSALARATDAAWAAVEEDAYAMRGLVFKNVARIKEPTSRLTVFTPSQRDVLRDRLEPGDIVLTFTAGYMSNVFLPGEFKHGIIYVGAPRQREDAGLTRAYLEAFAISDEQRDRLLEEAFLEHTADERPVDVIEAVAEGVKYSSLDYLLDTHVNRLLVLRPRLDADERRDQLGETVVRLGVPYDFKFDFSDPSHLCCTELVYRVLEGKGPFDLSFSRTRGQWVLTADDLARLALDRDGSPFEMVLFGETDPERDDDVARLLLGEDARLRVRELFD